MQKKKVIKQIDSLIFLSVQNESLILVLVKKIFCKDFYIRTFKVEFNAELQLISCIILIFEENYKNKMVKKKFKIK